MKRRLDLAVSMIERPLLLFLDEPTTGSTLAVENTLEAVRQLWTKEYDSLDNEIWKRQTNCGHIALLDDGRIVAKECR